MAKPWYRVRFYTSGDARPVRNPPGPYWESGYAADDSYTVMIAYLRSAKQVYVFWPEATNVTSSQEDAIEFCDRFPCPDDWDEDKERWIA